MFKSALVVTTLVLLASPVMASDQNGNSETEQGILNVHESHFPHTSGDSHRAEKGSSENYGSVLLDVEAAAPQKARQAVEQKPAGRR